KIAVGMAAFGHVMRSLMGARALVARAARREGSVADALMGSVEDLLARGERQAVQLDNYLGRAVHENHWPTRSSDERIITSLQGRLGMYSRDFILFVRHFPTEALERALAVARRQTLD